MYMYVYCTIHEKCTFNSRLILCSKSGYDMEAGRRNGYTWTLDFIFGNVNKYPKEVRTWSGDANLPWQQLEKQLFPPLKNDIEFFEGGNTTLTPILLLPLGNCYEIRNYPNKLYFNTKQNLSLLFSDPHRQNFYR